MATAACKTVAGVRSGSAPLISFTASCSTIAGIGSATGDVAWGGTDATQQRVNWLPNAQVPVLGANGQMAPVWYKFFKEIADNRLGGIEAPTVPQVIVQQVQTQSQVLNVQTGVQSVGQQVSAITTTVNSQTEVAQNSNLPGSTQIAKLPSFKQAILNGSQDA